MDFDMKGYFKYSKKSLKVLGRIPVLVVLSFSRWYVFLIGLWADTNMWEEYERFNLVCARKGEKSVQNPYDLISRDVQNQTAQ